MEIDLHITLAGSKSRRGYSGQIILTIPQRNIKRLFTFREDHPSETFCLYEIRSNGSLYAGLCVSPSNRSLNRQFQAFSLGRVMIMAMITEGINTICPDYEDLDEVDVTNDVSFEITEETNISTICHELSTIRDSAN